MSDIRDDRLDLLARVLGADPLVAVDRNAVWAIRGDCAAVPRVPIGQRRIMELTKSEPGGYHRTSDGLAIIELGGPLSKWASFWRLIGISQEPTLGELAGYVERAAADRYVSGIMLYVDSPGGTAWGTSELGDAVREAAGAKPVHAYANDLCCSAAYWIAAQADRLTSNAAADVGSIGVYSLLVDSSKLAETSGLKFVRLRTGEHKGVGVPGVEITDAEIKELQRGVDATHALFLSAVERGRPNLAGDGLRKLADGRTWQGEEAAQLGLTDGVETFDAALDHLRAAVRARRGAGSAKETAMADNTAPVPNAGNPNAGDELATLRAQLQQRDAELATERAATKQRDLEAAVDRDLAALSGKVPPGILGKPGNRALLVDLKKADNTAGYAAALELIGQADHSALLGESLAGEADTAPLKGSATTNGLTPEDVKFFQSLGMSAAEIAINAAKAGLN